MSRPDQAERVSDSDWQRQDAALEAFEQSCQQGTIPAIEEFLAGFSDLNRPHFLRELVKLDLEYRRRRGERTTIDDYLSRFPELARSSMAMRDLVAFASRVCDSRPPADQTPPHSNIRPSFGGSHEGGHAGDADETGIAGVEPSRVAGRSSPTQIGRYELREVVGRGGFATVYRAWDPELRRDVAIKVPREEFIGPGFVGRAQREARSAAQLRHPAIVPIYEVGTHDNTTFIVYEFLPGPTLAHLLHTTRPSPQQAAAWVARIAEALDYAHGCGVVHRDVKPANIMMDRHGEPMIADFGLARHSESGATLTHEGDILGTPAYMSPEQAIGQGHAADARSDVYSLGVLLYELLCGRVPFEGSSVSILHRVIHTEPAAPRNVRPTLPQDLETICMKAMAKEPSRRYATAGAMAEDLRAFLEHRPIRARRTSPFGHFVLWCRRRPALAATIALALVVIAGVASVSYRQVLAERDRFRAERDRAQENLYRSLLSDTRAQLQARDTGWWWKAMDNIRDAAALDVASADREELRELAVRCLGTKYPSYRLAATWPGHSAAVRSVTFNAAGDRAASASHDGTIRIWDVANGTTHATLAGHSASVSGCVFHPSGDWLVSSSADGTVRLWSVPRDRPATEAGRIELNAGAVLALAVTPTGDRVAAACDDGTVRLIAVRTSHDSPIPAAIHATHVLRGHTARVLCLAFTPDGSRLVSGSADKTIRFWDVGSGSETKVWSLANTPGAVLALPEDTIVYAESEGFGYHFRATGHAAASGRTHLHTGAVRRLCVDDDERLVTASTDGTIKLWNIATFTELATIRGDFAGVLAADVGSGGAILAGYADGQIRLWERAKPAAAHWLGNYFSATFLGPTRRLLTTTDIVYDFDWAQATEKPPGAALVSASVEAIACDRAGDRAVLGRGDGTIELVDLTDQKVIAHWPGHSGSVTSIVAMPRGDQFASAGSDGIVKIWSWNNQQLVETVDLEIGAIFQVGSSDDGSWLAASGEAGTVLWSIDDAHERHKLTTHRTVESGVAFCGRSIAVRDSSGAVQLVDLSSRARLRTLSSDAETVAAMAYSPHPEPNGRLAAITKDGSIRIWDLATGEGTITLRLPIASETDIGVPTWLAFDHTGKHLVSGSPFRGRTLTAMLWDTESGKFVANSSIIAHSAAPLQNASGFLLGHRLGSLMLWRHDVIGAARDATRSASGDVKATGWLTVYPDTTIVSGGHLGTAWGVASSPDGKWVATASHDRSVKLWDSTTRQLVRTLGEHSNLVWCVAFSPDSNYVVSGSATSSTGEIKVWEVESGRELVRVEGHKSLVTSIAFHPSGRWFATCASDGSVHRWAFERPDTPGVSIDVGDLGLFHSFGQAVRQLAVRPDGRQLAAACEDRTVAIWSWPDAVSPANSESRPPDQVLAGHTTAVWSVAYSSDSRYLASGADNGVITLRDAESLDPIVTLRGDTGQIRALSFSHDNQLLAGAAYVAPLVVWDLGRLRSTLRKMNLDW